ncbi:MAG: methyltransferase domain-containing protein [Vicinamibacteraceae bacterium]
MGFFDVFANNVLVKRLRGQSGHADLIAQMIGTRLGDRVLVIGGGDGRIVAAVGAPTGLTGRVTAVEPDAAVANQVELAATAAGVLVEVEAAGFDRLPFEDAAFDVAVVPMPATVEAVNGALADVWRVVRTGGRAMIVTAAATPGAPDQAKVIAALGQAGFRAARLLGERDGLAFYESSRPATRNPG